MKINENSAMLQVSKWYAECCLNIIPWREIYLSGFWVSKPIVMQ